MTDLEIFAVITSALIHDYEHTGTTNAFQINTKLNFYLFYMYFSYWKALLYQNNVMKEWFLNDAVYFLFWIKDYSHIDIILLITHSNTVIHTTYPQSDLTLRTCTTTVTCWRTTTPAPRSHCSRTTPTTSSPLSATRSLSQQLLMLSLVHNLFITLTCFSIYIKNLTFYKYLLQFVCILKVE